MDGTALAASTAMVGTMLSGWPAAVPRRNPGSTWFPTPRLASTPRPRVRPSPGAATAADYQLTHGRTIRCRTGRARGLYIHDLASGKAFSPLAAVWCAIPSMTYEAWHGQGFSTFRAKRGPPVDGLTHVVDPVDPVKISRLRIQNSGSVPVRLRVYAMPNGCLAGIARAPPRPSSRRVDAATGALLAQKSVRARFRRPGGLPGFRRRRADGHGRPYGVPGP